MSSAAQAIRRMQERERRSKALKGLNAEGDILDADDLSSLSPRSVKPHQRLKAGPCPHTKNTPQSRMAARGWERIRMRGSIVDEQESDDIDMGPVHQKSS